MSAVRRRALAELEVLFAGGVVVALGIAFTFSSQYFLTSRNIQNLLVEAAVLVAGVTVNG